MRKTLNVISDAIAFALIIAGVGAKEASNDLLSMMLLTISMLLIFRALKREERKSQCDRILIDKEGSAPFTLKWKRR